jgi:hypothetical protein
MPQQADGRIVLRGSAQKMGLWWMQSGGQDHDEGDKSWGASSIIQLLRIEGHLQRPA